MRAWLAIVVSVLVVAGAVLYASQSQRGSAEKSFREARIADELHDGMLKAEVALSEALVGSTERLPDVQSAQLELVADLRRAADLPDQHEEEAVTLAEMRRQLRRWNAAAADEIASLQGRGEPDQGADDRLKPMNAFVRAADEFRAHLDDDREKDTAAAARIPVLITVGLSFLFLLIGGVIVRRESALRRRHRSDETERLRHDAEQQGKQQRLAEALQVAADQSEAHALLSRHLEITLPGSDVHILNRNNSADRLEPSAPLPEGSPLGEALVVSRPRSCIAVRLSRPYDRGPGSDEVLTCELCGKLPTESSCRPLLVGGEVIGSVLVERPGGLSADEGRRIEASVTAAAPVLANLRNLAIAEMRAATDALTGLPNRRAVDDTIKRMLAQASRSMRPLAVLMFDLDHFKQINDTFGHERGDNALAGFGALLRSQMRAADFAGRSGGEEFIVLLPDTDRAGALTLAEKLRRSLHSMRIEGIDRRVTVSGGLAVFPDDALDVETIMRLADRALYTAKQHGRDRIEAVSAAGSEESSAVSDD
jgi:diguanylate cyclase (GGDEF)-like protein